jgi:hypothetical protein
MFLNINTDSSVKFTRILEELHKSALPVAIRGALNDAAFDVKKNTMPKKAAQTFINRKDTFFKANSKVAGATGFDVNTMKSEVGFFENKLINSSTNYSVKDLEQQEDGGIINMKTFIPTVYARTGGTKRGLVKPNYQLKKIRNKGIVNSKELTGKVSNIANERQRYMIAAKRAGVGGFVIHKRMLWQIKRITFKGNSRVERVPIYSVSKGRNIKVKGTRFMELASLETNKKMEGYYMEQAKKQINRLVKR